MDRKRKLIQGASYHVTCKINRDEIIFDNKTIATLLIDIILRCKKKYSFKIKNFCIMGNHIHFIITPGGDSSLPRIMQWINSVFAKAYNKLMKISGRLWKERYHSKVMETVQYLVNAFHYIVKNPVEAKLVTDARDYPDSGLYHYLHGRADVIDTDSDDIRDLYESYREVKA